MVVLFTLTFIISSYFIIKHYQRDRIDIQYLTSNTTVVLDEIAIEIVLQPTVPEIPPTD